MEIMTRSEAAKGGYYKYFTGRACKNGHLSYRYTKTGGCAECVHYHTKKYARELNIFHKRFINIQIRIHPDDKPLVEELAETLNKARGM